MLPSVPLVSLGPGREETSETARLTTDRYSKRQSGDTVGTVGTVNETIATAVRVQGRGAQTRLAEQMGVTLGTVSHWVNGRAAPEPHRWPAIEEALGLDPGSLKAAHRADRESASNSSDDPLAAMVAELSEVRDELSVLRARVEQLERTDHKLP